MKKIMSCMKLFFITAVTVLHLCAPPLYAGTAADTLKLKIGFRQGVSEMEPLLFSNGMNMETFVAKAETLKADSTCRVLKICIRSGSSLEDKFDSNRRLSEERGRSVASYLQRVFPDMRYQLEVNSVGEDWRTFRDIIRKTSSVPDRREILDILDRRAAYIDGRPRSVLGGPKKELMDLRGGATWHWLKDNVFAYLRCAEVSVIYERPQEERAVSRSDSIVVLHRINVEFVQEENPSEVREAENTAIPEDTVGVPKKDSVTRRIVMAPRMNLLLPLLNAGAEFPLGRRLSVTGNFYWPWIGYDRANSKCLQAMLGDLKLSWWFGQKDIEGMRGNTLTGHALSIGAVCGRYDFENDYSGSQGEIYGGYLDYGYTFCLGRHCRLGLGVGVGFAHIPYRTYTVYTEGGKLIRNRNRDEIRNWFGPMHAEVTLSFPITGGAR